MLRKLWIKGFRNFSELQFDFSDVRGCFVFGQNNQGKSNFLEAIYFLFSGRSPRESVFTRLVGFEQPVALLGGDFGTEDACHRVYVKLSRDGVRQVMVDGSVVRSYSRLRQMFGVSYVSADLIRVFQDSPESRRGFLDDVCAGMFSDYLSRLKRYERVVSQKNRMLKQSPSFDSVSIWNSQLVGLAHGLYLDRVAALACLSDVVNDVISSVASLSCLGVVSCRYVVRSGDDSEYVAWLTEKLRSGFVKELSVGYSLYGPHRDDFDVFFGDRHLMHFFSRGVNRAMAILLYLSSLVMCHRRGGAFPVLLLDDVFCELDSDMKRALMQLLLVYAQCFYASVLPDDRDFFSEGVLLQVRSGEVIRA